jgi:PAS domain S-box-containing protein
LFLATAYDKSKTASQMSTPTRKKKPGLKARRKFPQSARRLRAKAERLLGTTQRQVAEMPVDDVQKLVHELQVQQIELEMQNDELRRTWVELERTRNRYAELYDFAPTALLTLNPGGEILEANINTGQLLGLERDRLIHQKFSRFVPVESLDAFHLFCRQTFGSRTPQSVDLDLLNAPGKRLFVHVEAVRDRANRRMQCRLSLTDITGRRRAETALLEASQFNEQIVTDAREGVIVYDPDLKYQIWNPFMEELTGVTAAEVIGKHPLEAFPFLEAAGVMEQLKLALAGKNCATVDFHFQAPRSGRSGWVSDTNAPLRNAKGEIIGVIGIVSDITRRKQAEERVAQLNRVQAILIGINRAIVHIPDRQKLLDEVCQLAVKLGGFKLAWFGMTAPDGTVQPTAQAGATAYLKGIRVVTRDEPKGRGPVGTAIRENRAVMVEDINRDPRMAPWRERARGFGLRYLAAFPIRIEGKAVGAFSVYAPEAGFFDDNELALLNQVSDDISFALTAISDQAARRQAEDALRKSEARFKLIFDTVPVGIAFHTVHPDGSFTRNINPAHLRICGITRDEHDLPETYLKHTHPDDQPVQQQFTNQVNAGTIKEFSMEKRYVHPDGKIVWVHFSYQREKYAGGTTEELTTVVDITERRRMEHSLRRSENNLTIFFNQAPIGLLWLSAGGTILRANQTYLNLLGYSVEECVGQFLLDFCADPSQGRGLLERLGGKETVRNFPITCRCKDGNIRHVLVDAISFWGEDQSQYSSVFVRDITDRIEMEREILQAGDREHQRIAQDLHDGLGQLLAGTAYLAGILRQKLAAKSLPEARELGRILNVINEATGLTRSLARGLHPVEPEPNGLMAALQTLADRTKKLFHIRCHFNCPQPVLIENNAVATHLYRIAQEAVTNAIKHGRSKRIEIGLNKTPDWISLGIKDNGTGPPVRRQKKAGMGLRIMRYRAGIINGSLAVQKTVGGGTTVVCTVHFSSDEDADRHPKAIQKQRIRKD